MTGLVVLNNAIDTDHLDRLNAVMVPEALELFRMESTHHNFEGTFLHLSCYVHHDGQFTVAGSGNISQVPPVYKENLYPDIFANPIAAKIFSNIIGPQPELRYLHGTTEPPLVASNLLSQAFTIFLRLFSIAVSYSLGPARQSPSTSPCRSPVPAP